MNLLERAVLSALPAIPRPLMRQLSARYIAGETIEEALDKLRGLQGRGYQGVLDILGEDVADEAEARDVLRTYQEAATAASEAGLDSYVSVKPTHLGLRLSRDLCEELYADLLQHCSQIGVFARVEMEDHSTTDDTLAIFHALRARFDNVGIVLQSRLFRTSADVDALPESCDVRMVKGIYLEPAEIAHTTPDPIRQAFVDLTETLLKRGHTVAVATHDGAMADAVLERLESPRSAPTSRCCWASKSGSGQSGSSAASASAPMCPTAPSGGPTASGASARTLRSCGTSSRPRSGFPEAIRGAHFPRARRRARTSLRAPLARILSIVAR